MNIIIAGAHRVGKTTISTHLATRIGGTAYNASAASIYKARGVNPSDYLTFVERMDIQREIVLSYLDLFYSADSDINIFDRTLFDHLSYMQTYLLDVEPKMDQRSLVRSYSDLILDELPRYQKNVGALILVHPHKELGYVPEPFKGRNDLHHISVLDAHIKANVWQYSTCPIIQIPSNLPLGERDDFIYSNIEKLI